MKKIIVMADIGWAIRRIHDDVEYALKDEYVFSFYNSASFVWDSFMNDFKDAYLCLSTLNLYKSLLNVFPNVTDRCKLVIVHHGGWDGATTVQPLPCNFCTLGAVNRVHQQMIAKVVDEPVYLVQTGADPSKWNYLEHSGAVTTLGWCGAPGVASKNFDWAEWISLTTGLPLTTATSLTQDELRAWYNTVDILLVTAGPNIDAEAGPLPPFEAICSGTLVVGTPVGNFAELPGPKFTTKEEAVAILHELKTDPERVRRLAREQYDCVMAKWTYPTLKDQWRMMFDAARAKYTSQQNPV